MILYLLIILIFLYYISNHYFKKHFWYKVYKQLYITDNFYMDKEFNSVIERKINLINLNKAVSLYKSYFPASFTITETTIKNYFKKMENPAFIYKSGPDNLIGGVFNSINTIIYKKEEYKANFIDYAVVHYKNRNQNIFQSLMNSISKYTNTNKAKYIIFKIDMNPIPSFHGYNMTSNYYYLLKKNINYITKTALVQKKNIDESDFDIINKSLSSLKFYPYLCKDTTFANTLLNDDENITIHVDNKVIMNFKRHSSDHIELLYIFELDKIDIIEYCKMGLQYMKENESFDRITVDSIGFNIRIVELFEKTHITYHYILGLDEKLDAKDFYYYF
jgi:hypothetical protein